MNLSKFENRLIHECTGKLSKALTPLHCLECVGDVTQLFDTEVPETIWAKVVGL